jgi:hypothetical protein
MFIKNEQVFFVNKKRFILSFNHDFYLTHQMKGVSYSKKWRLYFPKYLEGKKETSLHHSHWDGSVREKI